MTPTGTTSPTTITTTMDSPIGELTLTADGGLLTGMHMHEQRHLQKFQPAINETMWDSRMSLSSWRLTSPVSSPISSCR